MFLQIMTHWVFCCAFNFFSRNLSSSFFFRKLKSCKTSFSSQYYNLSRKSLQAVAWEVERTVSLLLKCWSLGKEQELLVCFREINGLFRGSVEVTNALVKSGLSWPFPSPWKPPLHSLSAADRWISAANWTLFKKGKSLMETHLQLRCFNSIDEFQSVSISVFYRSLQVTEMLTSGITTWQIKSTHIYNLPREGEVWKRKKEKKWKSHFERSVYSFCNASCTF